MLNVHRGAQKQKLNTYTADKGSPNVVEAYINDGIERRFDMQISRKLKPHFGAVLLISRVCYVWVVVKLLSE